MDEGTYELTCNLARNKHIELCVSTLGQIHDEIRGGLVEQLNWVIWKVIVEDKE